MQKIYFLSADMCTNFFYFNKSYHMRVYVSIYICMCVCMCARVCVCVCVWWFNPNHLELLGLDLQFIFTLGWACPIMEGPKKCLIASLIEY